MLKLPVALSTDQRMNVDGGGDNFMIQWLRVIIVLREAERCIPFCRFLTFVIFLSLAPSRDLNGSLVDEVRGARVAMSVDI